MTTNFIAPFAITFRGCLNNKPFTIIASFISADFVIERKLIRLLERLIVLPVDPTVTFCWHFHQHCANLTRLMWLAELCTFFHFYFQNKAQGDFVLIRAFCLWNVNSKYKLAYTKQTSFILICFSGWEYWRSGGMHVSAMQENCVGSYSGEAKEINRLQVKINSTSANLLDLKK